MPVFSMGEKSERQQNRGICAWATSDELFTLSVGVITLIGNNENPLKTISAIVKVSLFIKRFRNGFPHPSNVPHNFLRI
jgi:hypothetical protein